MPFQVSPGVNVSEIDLTTIVPAVSTTEGGLAGVFRWGPIEDRQLISDEDELVRQYGKPNDNNYETFFTAASFLAYGNKLYVSRAASTTAYNARALSNSTATAADVQIKNKVTFENFTADANVYYYAKYAGALGNSLRISVCDSANAYHRLIWGSTTSSTTTAGADYGDSTINTAIAGLFAHANNGLFLNATVGSANATLIVTSTGSNTTQANTDYQTLIAQLTVGDYVRVGNTTIGFQDMKIKSFATTPTSNGDSAYSTLQFENRFTLSSDVEMQDGFVRLWEFYNTVDSQPDQSSFVTNNTTNAAKDEMHIVVSDADGKWSGTRGTILEVWAGVSRATDAKSEQGGSLYYKDVLKNGSRYIYNGTERAGATAAAAASVATSTNSKPFVMTMTGGADGSSESAISNGQLATAYDQFKSAEQVDISLILCGKAVGGTLGEQISNYVIDNIAEFRKDCVAFISPPLASVVNNVYSEMEDIIAFRDVLRSTSYAVLDSGYKYTYDRYNDKYRYVPLNGDTAGLCVRTDELRDPWYSPAGFNRGQIKNIVKLAYNPDKADRDQLYKKGVNPVVTFPGQGTILYGDKTLLAKPSAFDRINVRRLFIVLEKSIATSAKYTLFEFNDEFTRATFRNLVGPFLRDVQGRRGIYDYKVVCDTTNNTAEVIDRNEFIGDIYIKPARSINFIQLNFVAVRTGVQFEEIVGRF
jgi:phage tail sheath protein FI